MFEKKLDLASQVNPDTMLHLTAEAGEIFLGWSSPAFPGEANKPVLLPGVCLELFRRHVVAGTRDLRVLRQYSEGGKTIKITFCCHQKGRLDLTIIRPTTVGFGDIGTVLAFDESQVDELVAFIDLHAGLKMSIPSQADLPCFGL